MKALGASYFNLSVNKQRDKDRVALTTHQFGFHVHQKRVLFCAASISCSSQKNMGSEAIQTVISDRPKTVRVRFKLHKQCAFGQQFLVVGDDPNLGLWDPSEGVPLNWSEGHVWTGEVDVPCGKVISYKFVLEEMAGAVLWQPGPDRVLETWDTSKTISVSEDWESPDFQNVVEEEHVVVDDLNEFSWIDDEKAGEEGVDGDVPNLLISEDLDRGVVEEGNYVVERELDGNERMSDRSDEPVMLLVAENISEEKDSSVSDGLMSVAGEEEEETTRVVIEDGAPVLVPGLATFPAADEVEVEEAEADAETSSIDRSTTADEIEDSTDSNQNNSKTFEDAATESYGIEDSADLNPRDDSAAAADESDGIEDSADLNPRDDSVAAADESEGIEDSADLNPRDDNVVEDTRDAATIEREVVISRQCSHTLQTPAEEEKPRRLNRERQVLDNDVQWGRRALHKFLANLGFMQHS